MGEPARGRRCDAAERQLHRLSSGKVALTRHRDLRQGGATGDRIRCDASQLLAKERRIVDRMVDEAGKGMENRALTFVWVTHLLPIEIGATVLSHRRPSPTPRHRLLRGDLIRRMSTWSRGLIRIGLCHLSSIVQAAPRWPRHSAPATLRPCLAAKVRPSGPPSRSRARRS